MKVVFLDIDGVINSNFWMESHQQEISDGTLIDKEKIELVAKIVSKTEASLVMHSGWRFWFDNTMQPIRKQVRTNAEVGLTEKDVDKAIEMLL